MILNLKDLNSEQSISEKQNSKVDCQNCICRRTSNFCATYCGKNNQGISLYSFGIPFEIAQLLVDFCYTGTISSCDNSVKLSADTLPLLLDAAENLGISHLGSIVSVILKGEVNYVADLSDEFLNHRLQNIRKHYVKNKHFSDVIFQVDDGFVHGHKVLLSSGCDMMNAMFAGSFVESENKQVIFPTICLKYIHIINNTDMGHCVMRTCCQIVCFCLSWRSIAEETFIEESLLVNTQISKANSFFTDL